jgi:hypothetical protein
VVVVERHLHEPVSIRIRRPNLYPKKKKKKKSIRFYVDYKCFTYKVGQSFFSIISSEISLDCSQQDNRDKARQE